MAGNSNYWDTKMGCQQVAHKEYSLTTYHSVYQSWIINDKLRLMDHVSVRSDNISGKNLAGGLSHD